MSKINIVGNTNCFLVWCFNRSYWWLLHICSIIARKLCFYELLRTAFSIILCRQYNLLKSQRVLIWVPDR